MNNNIFADNNFRKILEEQIKALGKNRMPIPNTNEDFPEDNMCIDNIERMVKEMGKGVFNPDPFMLQKLQKLRNQQEVQISGESYPKVNVSKNDSSFIIRAYIPGIRKSDINIAINDNKLTISSSAEIKSKASMTDEFCLIKEFDDSSNILGFRFKRVISFEKNANLKSCIASFENGLLQITVPLLDEQERNNSFKVEIK
jgi:HSP20 family protein